MNMERRASTLLFLFLTCIEVHHAWQLRPSHRRKRLMSNHGTSGSVFDKDFLSSIHDFYSEDTSTELMGPLLYSLFRTQRPEVTVELGAGYTTFWLAKAAQDAAAEASVERELCENNSKDASWVLWDSIVGRNVISQAIREGTYTGSGKLTERSKRKYEPVFHCVDIFSGDAGSHYCNVHAFEDALERAVGSSKKGHRKTWQLHASDWSEWRQKWDDDSNIDLLWLDGFNKETFELYWPLVNPDGGVCVLHSTQNNHRNFQFVNELKLKQATSSFCDYELLSLIEPHKWQQNSCTLLRKISAFEPEEHLVRGRA